jgi:sorting nexin-1/2
MRAVTDRGDSAWECPGWAKTGQALALVLGARTRLNWLIMSGFDDLLQQSSRALEENPFEDPFARPRSGSPDPWSSYNHPSATISNPAFEYDDSGFGGVSTTTTTQAAELQDNTLSSPTVESHSYDVHATPSDPLDSANLPADDETEFSTKPTTSRYAAFRESVGTDPFALPSQPLATSSEPVSEPDPPSIVPPTLPSIISPPATTPLQLSSPVTPSSAIPTESAEHTVPPSPPPPSSARLPQRQEALQPSAHPPFDPSSSTVDDSHRVISSPLDQPPVAAFASLALGGESFNGFDGAQSAFVNSTSHPSTAQDEEEDDDDDDDKPLLPRPVSNTFHCCLWV